ncbi:hypothetical protein QBC44DRAFT_359227 [Cladorrhinum sp. PSN332]|nr:hypothetical protein QBC44DRAFT_359227 [Cladorrhinum sp. PSN332]
MASKRSVDWNGRNPTEASFQHAKTGLSPINAIAAAQIAIYVPYLFISILLAARHGFRRNAGWLYLLIFTLTRLVAASLQLSTTSTPPTAALLIATQIFYSVGLSALILTLLNLLGRILSSIQHSGGHTTTTTTTTTTAPLFITPRHQRLAQLVVLVGLILGVVGGSLMGSEIDAVMSGEAPYGIVEIPTESQAGLGLMIAGFAGVVAGTMSCLLIPKHYKEAGEKRLLWAAAATIPFMIVRVAFSGLATFGDDPRFRGFGGSGEYAWWFLGMAVVMEVVVVGVLEAVGLTLKRVDGGGGGVEGQKRGSNRRRRLGAGVMGRRLERRKRQVERLSGGMAV